MIKFYGDKNIIEELKSKVDKFIIICIGTDKHVWDSLAPMVGSMIEEKYNAIVYGTLNEPVTAINVDYINNELEKTYPFYCKLVIDISVSSNKELNKKIYIKRGGIKPGLGVGVTDLNIIGDYSILYYVFKEDMSNKRIRNPYNGALEIMKIIDLILEEV